MYFDFLRNIIEVLFFSNVIILIDLFFQKKYAQHVKGIIFGLITIFIMNNGILITEGRFFDFRHIIMTMAGFIGGPVTATIAALIGTAYRIYVGGSGVMGGISSIIFFGFFGIILARYRRSIPKRNKVWFWFLTGIVIEVAHLSIIAFIHPSNVDSIAVLKIISAPLLIITPLATIIIFNFYYWAYEFFSKSLILNIIIKHSDIKLMIFDTDGPIMNSKNLKEQSKISQYLLEPVLLQDKDEIRSNLTKYNHQDIKTEDGKSYIANVFGLQMPSGEPAWVAIVNDVTSLKMAEKEIARLDRLKLVGQMAAGIGHEIRNPMTTVRGFLQLLGRKPQNEAQKPTFDLMISELDRANSIISEFLLLARTKQTELQLQSLNDILKQLYPLLEADTFNQNKKIEYFPGDIPNLELNKKEISQLVLNLARNGLDAMDERGCLTIKTYVKENKVIFSVEDEGCGVSPDDLDKLGTPFYTTKDNGTGMGLATSFKIAESHNAKIDVDSSPGGTKFFISFPIPDKHQGQNKMIV